MGWQKDEMERREEGAYEAARRDNRRCGGAAALFHMPMLQNDFTN